MHSAETTLVIWFIVLFVLFVILACIFITMMPKILNWLMREIPKGLTWKD